MSKIRKNIGLLGIVFMFALIIAFCIGRFQHPSLTETELFLANIKTIGLMIVSVGMISIGRNEFDSL